MENTGSLSKPCREGAARINLLVLLFFYLIIISSYNSQTHRIAREVYMITFQGRKSDGEERKVDLESNRKQKENHTHKNSYEYNYTSQLLSL